MAYSSGKNAVDEMLERVNSTNASALNANTAWQKMMAQLAAANNTRPETMAGFALGKLLRNGFDTWKQNYDDRGYVKDQLMGLSEEEMEKKLAGIKDPKRVEYMRNIWQERNGAQAQAQPQINQAATQALTQDALANKGLLGNGFPPKDYDFNTPAAQEMLDNPYLRKMQEMRGWF